MTDHHEAIAHLLLKQAIEEFPLPRGRALDERRYEEWLELLADDVRYWMPMRRNVRFGELEREFTREGLDINWFDEGKDTLTRRVQQILTGVHWAEEPLSRICHMISNIQLLHVRPCRAGAGRGRGQMPLPDLPQSGTDETDILVGKREDVLRRVNGQWKIAQRKVILDQNVLLAKT